MIILESLDEINNMPASCVALGNFDGVHLGHQALIKTMVCEAREKGLAACVFTFSSHPKNIIPGVEKVKNILYNSEKAAIIENLDVDYMVNIPFTKDIMVMSPEDFIDKLLIDKLNMKSAFCGFNYNFGFKGQGNPDILRANGREKGFTVTEMPAFSIDNEVVSSTLIRELIAAGEMEKVKAYMGKYYDIGGEVVVGNRLGKSIGFPTSNLSIDMQMVTPPNGVYVTYCIYNGKKYPSVTNVGVKPTIGEFSKNIETHIFNFDKELYGKNIIVEFIKKTRDEKKFESIEALSAQIKRDCENAKEYHGL